MTTGQMVFYSGVGLLVLTILLGIFFMIKKPQYIPEQAGYVPVGPNQTQKLRNGYPTDPVTKGKHIPSVQQGTELLEQEVPPTQMQTASATELMAEEPPKALEATGLL